MTPTNNKWPKDVKLRQAEREQVKQRYGALFDQISQLLFKYDPIGINFEFNTDEYDPEAGTILPRLETCFSEEQALEVVYEEFVKWFDIETAGSIGRYRELARNLWQIWQGYRNG